MVCSAKKIQQARLAGFTLVELSIVVIIIGLLITGISAGASLMEQARLNTVITDLQTYKVAFNAFTSTYKQFPGDINSASVYWPTGCVTSVNTDCNGNGNGQIDSNIEALLVWNHLYLAGFISSGIIPLDNTITIVTVGQNTPASKISGAGYQMAEGIGFNWETGVKLVGIARPTAGSQSLDDPSLTSSQAFNIDTKIDDGFIDNTGAAAGALSGAIRSFTLPFITPPILCTDDITGETYVTLGSATSSCGTALRTSW
jgi:prepilin-type N-terminal cleavage/methylation domain-containing protein